MWLWYFPFGKSSHCESSQLPPPLTGPGPGLLNSHQPYYLIRHPIVAVLMSQDLHKMPIHWLPHSMNTCWSIHCKFSMGWSNTGLPVNKRFVSCSELGVQARGQSYCWLSHVSYPLSPIHVLLSSIKAHCCEDKAIIIRMSHCCEDEAIIIWMSHCCWWI